MAASVKVTAFGPSVTVVGSGMVPSVGLAVLTVTCSETEPLSLAVLLFTSPL